MKKILFFAAMLSFAVACGGNQQQNNAEEAAQAPEAAVENVEVVATPQPEEVTVAKPEEATEAETETVKIKETKLKVNNTLTVKAATDKEESAEKFTVTEIKPAEEPAKLEVKEGKKTDIKVSGDLKVVTK